MIDLRTMADSNEEAVADVFERHVPQHPLPEEIKQMNRDDTVCKFCGVSYLIHSELKAMENKLKTTLEEMEHYKGSVAREAKLRKELEDKEVYAQGLGQRLMDQDIIVGKLKTELQDRDDQCTSLQVKNATLEEQLQAVAQEAQTFRQKHEFLSEGLRNLKTHLGHQKADVHQIMEKVAQQNHQMKKEHTQLVNIVTRVCQKEYQVNQQLEDSVANFKAEQKTLRDEISELKNTLKSSASEINILQTSLNEAETLKVQLHQQEHRIQGFEAEKVTMMNQKRSALLEINQYKEQLRQKSNEIENIQVQSRNQAQVAEMSISRLKQEVDKKEAELGALRHDVFTLQRRYEETERAEAEIQRQASASHSLATEIEEELKRSRGDCDALRAEREMMIAAHQNQIEQLRESFKLRLADVDHWPKKMEEELRRQKQKYVGELEALETKLKESFVHELQIEKQKHQKLLDKYLMEYKEEDRKLKSELNTVQSRHKAEIAEIHRQVAESKARARESETSVRQEVESLKNIIQDLEARLARADGVGETVPAESINKMAALEQTLEQVKEEKDKLNQEIEKIKEESTFLQETVRRECEERFELTEALNVAKEELLQLRRPPGGYASSSSTPRQGNSPLHSAGGAASHSKNRSTSRLSGQRSEEVLLYKKRATSVVPHPPGRARDEGTVDTSSSHLLSYDGEMARSAGKIKGGSLGDSRRRIAEAVGRT